MANDGTILDTMIFLIASKTREKTENDIWKVV